jgi:archaemetzincin
MIEVRIVPVGEVSRDVLEFLALALSDGLDAACSISGEVLDPSDAYDPTRRQYNSTHILGDLLEVDSPAHRKILGVANVDLFIPIFTFVFGQAQLGNRAALVSVHRLRQQFYGLPENQVLFLERCEKEAMHELGHTLGLVHCEHFECVMRFSNSIEEVDLKRPYFCSSCALALSEQSPRVRTGQLQL